METKITKYNIIQYRNNRFDEIIKIKWGVGELDKKVIDNFPNLQELDCGNNKIKSLEPLSDCVNLQILDCKYNQIKSLEPLSNCVNLQILNCGSNKITSLEPLSNCVNLYTLYCSSNKITSLESLSNCVNLHKLYCGCNRIKTLQPLSNCVNLQTFFCHNNLIKSIEPLSNCVNLQQFDCHDNQITTLEPFHNCVNLQVLNFSYNYIASLKPLHNFPNLQTLYCGGNKITTLEPLSICVNLQILNCWKNQITTLEPLSVCVNLLELYFSRNQITSLEPLIYLIRLRYIDYSNNPIEVPTLQIQRMLNRIVSNKKSSIYKDNQNVHDTEIQRTVCDSVQNLLKDPKNDFTIDEIIDSSLNKSTIESLIEYCQDQTIHSVHLITYHELLGLIWNRIQNSIHKTELKKILEEQIADSECKCFTGRFNRTLSVLVGFFDDIKINISDKSRISAIILNSKDKIIPYDAVKHKELAIKELLDAGYLETDFKDWIEAIQD